MRIFYYVMAGLFLIQILFETILTFKEGKVKVLRILHKTLGYIIFILSFLFFLVAATTGVI